MLWLLLRTLVFTVLVPGTALLWLPRWLMGSRSGIQFDVVGVAGLIGLAAGLAVMAVCYGAFIVRGRGTPAPYDAPRFLVTGLLYRYVRNPIYLGVTLAALGEAGLFHSLALVLYAGALWLCFHITVVAYEEPGLRQRFGLEYETYLRDTPRWLPIRRRRGGRGQEPQGRTAGHLR